MSATVQDYRSLSCPTSGVVSHSRNMKRLSRIKRVPYYQMSLFWRTSWKN